MPKKAMQRAFQKTNQKKLGTPSVVFMWNRGVPSVLDQTAERAFCFNPVPALLLAQIHVQNIEVLAGFDGDPILDAVGFDRLPVHQSGWETKHQPSTPPVGQIKMGVEIARQNLERGRA